MYNNRSQTPTSSSTLYLIRRFFSNLRQNIVLHRVMGELFLFIISLNYLNLIQNWFFRICKWKYIFVGFDNIRVSAHFFVRYFLLHAHCLNLILQFNYCFGLTSLWTLVSHTVLLILTNDVLLHNMLLWH